MSPDVLVDLLAEVVVIGVLLQTPAVGGDADAGFVTTRQRRARRRQDGEVVLRQVGGDGQLLLLVLDVDEGDARLRRESLRVMAKERAHVVGTRRRGVSVARHHAGYVRAVSVGGFLSLGAVDVVHGDLAVVWVEFLLVVRDVVGRVEEEDALDVDARVTHAHDNVQSGEVVLSQQLLVLAVRVVLAVREVLAHVVVEASCG